MESFTAFVMRCLTVLAGSFVVVAVFQFIRWLFERVTNRMRSPQKGDLWSDIDGRLIVVLERDAEQLTLSRYLTDPTVGRFLGCWREDLDTFSDRVRSHGRKFVEQLEPENVLKQWAAMEAGRMGGRRDDTRPQVSPSPDREE